MILNKPFLWTSICTALVFTAVSSFAQTPAPTTPPATTPPPAETPAATPPAGTSGTDAGASGPKWSASVDGMSGSRQLSPTGDILDSNMDALAPLSLDPLNIPKESITVKDLTDVKKASAIIRKALYLPLDKEERDKLNPKDVLRIRTNQRLILQQISAHDLTFGITSAQNVSDFQKRKDTAATFIPSAENEREDIQVLTGLTLGQFAETNKMLALTASLALLEAADSISSASSLLGE